MGEVPCAGSLSKSAVRTSPTPMRPAPTMVPGEKGALTGQSAAACSCPAGVRPAWFYDAAKDWKHIRCSTCGQAISILSKQGKSRQGGRGSQHQPMSPGLGQTNRRCLHLRILNYACTHTFPCVCKL